MDVGPNMRLSIPDSGLCCVCDAGSRTYNESKPVLYDMVMPMPLTPNCWSSSVPVWRSAGCTCKFKRHSYVVVEPAKHASRKLCWQMAQVILTSPFSFVVVPQSGI